MGTGFCIGEGVMMICQVEAAMCSDGMKLMVFQIREYLYGSPVSTIKLIIRIFHLIMSETGFQASLIETFIMSHQRKISHIFRCFTPDFRKDRSFFRIFLFDSMNLGVPVAIIIRNRFYETIKE